MDKSLSDISVLILAGGLATRLRPITEKIPKSLVEVAGRPFIDWQLELLQGQGLKKIVLSVGYLGEMLEDYVRNLQRSGKFQDLDIYFVYDGDKLRGTGGATLNALELLSDPFFILYGDSYLPCKFDDHLKNFNPDLFDAQMSVYENKGRYDASNVYFAKGKIIDYEKKTPGSQHTYIDWGLSLFTHPAFFPFKKEFCFDLAIVFKSVLSMRKLQGFEVKERFYEIGTTTGIQELEKYLVSFN